MPRACLSQNIKKNTAPGFADGAYEAQQLAEGVLGFADLRPFNASADFIGQFRHTTTIGYEDSVSINVARDSDGHSLVRMFSYSLIGGHTQPRPEHRTSDTLSLSSAHSARAFFFWNFLFRFVQNVHSRRAQARDARAGSLSFFSE